MTVEVSGLANAEARVAQIHARFGLDRSGSAASASASTSAGASAFDASMRTALAGHGAGTATAEAPFVHDPARGPGQVQFKPGAAAALAAAPAAAVPPAGATASGPAAGLSGVSAATGNSSAAATNATSATAATAAASGVGGVGPTAERLIAAAKKYLGVPYKWGGTNPATGGLDCSGFTQRAFKDIGISIPRVARDQQDAGTKVASLAQAKPGDLIFFGDPAHHVTMYLGNNKMIHAPRTGEVVKIVDVYRTPTSIRRFLPEEAAQPAGGVAAAAAPAAAPAAARAAAVGATSPALATAAASSIGASSSTSRGGWTGAPVDDTWGAASANAARLNVDQLVSGTPGAALDATAAVPVTASVAGADRVTAAAGSALAQAPAHLRSLFAAAGQRYGVSADLLAAVAKQESNFKATAVSHAGARGLMQLMPGTARGLGVRDSFDPAQAVDGAARLLRDHLRTFGSTELALAAYNAGPGAVRRYDGIPPYSETQNYVRKIMANLRAGAA